MDISSRSCSSPVASERYEVAAKRLDCVSRQSLLPHMDVKRGDGGGEVSFYGEGCVKLGGASPVCHVVRAREPKERQLFVWHRRHLYHSQPGVSRSGTRSSKEGCGIHPVKSEPVAVHGEASGGLTRATETYYADCDIISAGERPNCKTVTSPNISCARFQSSSPPKILVTRSFSSARNATCRSLGRLRALTMMEIAFPTSTGPGSFA